MSETICFSGALTAIRFQEGNYIIGKFQTDKSLNFESIMIKGTIYGVSLGERFDITAKPVFSQKYGFQYKIVNWKRSMPSTKKQALDFLSSSLIKGCGNKTALKIVETLGENAISIIKNEGSKCLLTIKGISSDKALLIAASVKTSFEIQEFATELANYGININTVTKIYAEHKSNTLEIVKQTPYIILQYERKMNFFKIDEIALKLNISPLSTNRVSHAIQYALNILCFENGHCFEDFTLVIRKTVKILNHHVDHQKKVFYNEVEQTAYLIAETPYAPFIIEKDIIYPRNLYSSELQVAQKITLMINRPGSPKVSADIISNELTTYQKKNHIILAHQQKQATIQMFQNQLLLITGQAGTGKTTVLKTMIDIYKVLHPKGNVGLAAPTGRAKKRMQEVTGQAAATIHKLLEIDVVTGLPLYNKENPLPYDILFVDEFSMVGIKLAAMLFNALKPKAQIIIFGDPEQLPSVDAGYVLGDLLKTNVPHVYLDAVFRQKGDSQIIKNAHRIIKGLHLLVDMRKKDFFFYQHMNDYEIQKVIVHLVLDYLQQGYKLEDIMLLSPQKKGAIGTIELNRVLQDAINPSTRAQIQVKTNEHSFRVGDIIIHLQNDETKQLSNGDIGKIVDIREEINPKNNRNQLIIECIYDNRIVTYEKNELSDIDLAYCKTIHKAQGTEAAVVIMPLSMTHKRNLKRNLFYTGVSRAKETFIGVGTIEATYYAVQTNDEILRHTQLAERIQQKTLLARDTLKVLGED